MSSQASKSIMTDGLAIWKTKVVFGHLAASVEKRCIMLDSAGGRRHTALDN
jgi:hypothetical protein